MTNGNRLELPCAIEEGATVTLDTRPCDPGTLGARLIDDGRGPIATVEVSGTVWGDFGGSIDASLDVALDRAALLQLRDGIEEHLGLAGPEDLLEAAYMAIDESKSPGAGQAMALIQAALDCVRGEERAA